MSELARRYSADLARAFRDRYADLPRILSESPDAEHALASLTPSGSALGVELEFMLELAMAIGLITSPEQRQG